jgi:hypothetical protein
MFSARPSGLCRPFGLVCSPTLQRRINKAVGTSCANEHTSVNLATKDHARIAYSSLDYGAILCAIVDYFVLAVLDFRA